MKITLNIDKVSVSVDSHRYECCAEFEHDHTQWRAMGTSLGEVLLNVIEMIRPMLAKKLYG